MALAKKQIVIFLSYVVTFLAGFLLHYGVSMFDDFFGPWFYQRGSYSLPQTVVAEKLSPDNSLKASVLTDQPSGAYYLAIQKGDGPRLIIDADFVPHSGYHHPILALSWNRSSDRVFLTVDHDFGDNILTYLFDINDFSWIEQ